MESRVGGARLLVVECAEIRALLRLMLERQGYQVLESSLEEAITVLGQDEVSFGAIITNTPEFFFRYAALVPILYVAAIPDPVLTANCAAVLRKPFTYRDLSETIRGLLNSTLLPAKPASSETGAASAAVKKAAGRI